MELKKAVFIVDSWKFNIRRVLVFPKLVAHTVSQRALRSLIGREEQNLIASSARI